MEQLALIKAITDATAVAKEKELLAIVGPTASGKTDLGIAVAKHRGGAVISADSRQVYTDMNSGTAKPEEAWSSEAHATGVPDEVEGIDHYLLNIKQPDQRLALAKWQEAAKDIIAKVDAPLLVGGTMLYVESIVFNYDIPSVPEQENVRKDLEAQETAELWGELLAKDPAAEQFINSENRRRIIRALEVISVTGQPFSQQRQQKKPEHGVTMVGLFPGWDALAHRLEKRHREMLETTLPDETKDLVDKYGRDLPLLKTMNYQQALALIEGTMTLPEALADTLRVNMRYAHRQMSWWRRAAYQNDSLIRWFSSAEDALEQLLT